MSLLTSNKLIDIKVYYKLIKKDGFEKVKVLEDKEAEEAIFENEKLKREFEAKQKDEETENNKEGEESSAENQAKSKPKPKNEKFVLDPNKQIHILNTKWKEITWKEQNDILAECRSMNQFTGLQDIDHLKFRDQRIKMCLKEWDLKDDAGNNVPCHPEIIEQLPFDVVFALVNKFDKLINLDEEEEKKS